MKKRINPISRSENMSRIKGSNTSIELKLRRALWQRGLRYRINCKDVFGKPDICFKSKKIAIFCDSEYWHGKYFMEGKYIPKTNRKFWVDKIKSNIKRDKQVNNKLEKEGWIVLRFWGKEINQNTDKCVDKILEVLNTSEKAYSNHK